MPGANSIRPQMRSADVGSCDAMHETPQVTIGKGPKHHMPMVRHKAIPQDTHLNMGQGLRHDLLEFLEVLCPPEDAVSLIPSVNDVKHDATGC
jgi:hypothetical protein